MPKDRSRFSSRHLLAMCTFLVPLLLLAFFGAAELRRQGTQAQASLERQANQFLREAAQTIEHKIDERLTAVLARSVELMRDRPVVAAIRDLRGDPVGGALLDLLLLDDHGALVWPTPPPDDLGLPLNHLPRARPGSSTDRLADGLQLVDVELSRGQFAAAADMLHALAEQTEQAEQPPARSGREPGPSGEQEELAADLHYLYGVVLKKLDRRDEAKAQFTHLHELAHRGRSHPQEVLSLDALAELGLVELDDTPGERLRLMRIIAAGERDYLADGLLEEIFNRLRSGIAPGTLEPKQVDDVVLNDQVRRHARAFAVEYRSFLQGPTFRHLNQSRPTSLPTPEAPVEPPPILHAFTTAGLSSLLAVRAATAAETTVRHCNFVALRFDLLHLLGNDLDRFCRSDGAFVLAILDDDETPVIAAPATAPADYEPTIRQVRGLQLRAYPTDLEALMLDAQQSTRNSLALVVVLFLVAASGAIWMWRSANREAELATLKVDLVSRVSHELKTPLALIRMYGETLALGRARDGEQTARFGSIIEREADRLTTMIQRLLDFSRQQAGSLQYTPTAVNLAELLGRVTDAYRPHLESRGASLSVELQPGLLANVDAAAFESAVVNLLENAIKYAAEPEPDRNIRVELRRRDQTAELLVLDRGRGVPPGERERIFDSFYRASNAGEVRGAGLGLNLVQHFAAAHGGRIAVLPRDGGGSVFCLHLPLLPDQP